MEKLDGMSMDMEQTEKEKLRTLFPQCFVEDRLDIDKLLTMCGEYIDDDFEKYEFKWKGKRDCLKLAQMRSTATLRPCPEESVNFDTTKNLYIEGDNLEVLKLLQKAYFRRVKMIYIDPPYNTGNDFVYEDDFTDTLARYTEVTSQTTKSNPETMGRFHTAWLNMIYPRLRLAANLLRDDGVIFISIDDHEVHNLRKVCDEVFGEENFISIVSVTSNPRGRQSDTFLATVNDFLLIYCKERDKCQLNGAQLTDEQKAEYKYQDANGNYYRLLGLRQRGAASKRSERPEMYFPIYVDKDTKRISLEDNGKSFEVFPKKSDGSDGRWSWGKNKCKVDNQLLVARLIEKRNEYDIFFIDYLVRGDTERTRKFKTIWDEKDYNNQYGTQEVKKLLKGDYMSYPKSSRFVGDICQVGSNPGDIVLDFFSGSATTAQAVMDLNKQDGGNRQFIMVQLPERLPEQTDVREAGYKTICDLGKERIRCAGTQLLETSGQGVLGQTTRPLDIGFKVFKLDSSNLKTWDSSHIPAEEQKTLLGRLNDMIERVKPDRTDMDMIYEVMLKLGVPLDFPVAKLDLNDATAYSIGEDCLLLVCLEPGLGVETLEQLADYAPAKMILAETSFDDDSGMSNAYYTLRDRGIEFKFI